MTIRERDLRALAGIVSEDRPDMPTEEGLPLSLLADLMGQVRCDGISLERQMIIRRHIVQPRALMLRGSAADAEAAARRGLELAERTNLVGGHAGALLTLADALEAWGLPGDATLARCGAVELFRAKGNLPTAANVERARQPLHAAVTERPGLPEVSIGRLRAPFLVALPRSASGRSSILV